MPHAGLSLVGFMEEAEAMRHLKRHCIPKDVADKALGAFWRTARERLGAPMAEAGKAGVLPLPSEAAAYIADLKRVPWVETAFDKAFKGGEFKLVEIDPLIAPQYSIELGREGVHGLDTRAAPNIGKALEVCLPKLLKTDRYEWYGSGDSVVIRSLGGELNITKSGYFTDWAGITFGNRLPFAQSVRFNRRYYLYNGFHRALTLRAAGFTHMPCLVREVDSLEDAGVSKSGSTLKPALFKSANVPTMAHYTRRRAIDVVLRQRVRILHVSWSEHTVYED